MVLSKQKAPALLIGVKAGTAIIAPFTVPTGYNELDIYTCWKSIAPNTSVRRCVFVSRHVPQARRSKQIATPDYAHVLNYGYVLTPDKA